MPFPYILSLCLFFGSVSLPPQGEVQREEVGRLQARIGLLEQENKGLRAQVEGLKETLGFSGGPEARKRLMASADRLKTVREMLQRDPDNANLRKEALTLGRRVVRFTFYAPMVWQTLLDIGALKDGLTIDEAEDLLGPATDGHETWIGWYYNPWGRHVAPFLSAQVGKNGLSNWKIGRR